MYNVRYIAYPTGYQFRLYSEVFGSDEFEKNDDYDSNVGRVGYDLIDNVTGEVLVGDFFREVKTDEWVELSEEINFENLESIVMEQEEKKRAESLRVSFTRTRNNLYYIARSNIWDYFVTLTIDPGKIDRYDFTECSKKVRKWFNNLKRKAKGLYYLVVPEQHKDGAWHFHGLLGGCTGLTFVDSGKFTESGEKIYNLEDFKYGFSTATAVTDSARVSGYICKYITKDMCSTVSGRQRYWVSQNVQRAQIYEGCLNPLQIREIRERLLSNAKYQKKVQSVFADVEYYELPADFEI